MQDNTFCFTQIRTLKCKNDQWLSILNNYKLINRYKRKKNLHKKKKG